MAMGLSSLSPHTIASIKGWFILISGVGMLVVALQGLVRGQLPVGRGGLGPQRIVVRTEQPVLFWFMFIMLALIGLLAVRYGLASI